MFHEDRFENGMKIAYFKTINEAKKYEKTNFCIAEMPLNSYMIYNNIIYKILNYNNKNGKMLCTNHGENEPEIEIDSSENAYYLGGLNHDQN